MERFLGWMQELEHRKGKLTGTISLWLKGEESNASYTLVLTSDGVLVKEPGLRSADLVLSMKVEFFAAWMDGSLEPGSMSPGALAWDGDLQLFRELGFRMSNAPMLPHQSLLRHLNPEES